MLNELLTALTIVATCVAIHTIGMLIFAERALRRLSDVEGHQGFTHSSVLLLLAFAVIMFLHIFEASLWAGFYYARGLFENYETALYFSLICYTTIGFGDVVLPQKWRLLGAIEGISGVLLCGLSTAFLFAIVNGLFRMRVANKASHPEVAQQRP